MSDKVIIEVRANEWPRRNGNNPHVPYSPEQIPEDAAACGSAGASIIHYHARHPVTGAPSTDLAIYADTIRRIREKRPDLIVMPTLGMSLFSTAPERVSHITAM